MTRLCSSLLLTCCVSLSAEAQGNAEMPAPPCKGERVVVLPLFPVATSPGVARQQEERLREELMALNAYCVQPRAQTLSQLGPVSAIACEDAACRKRISERMDGDWVIFGMVFGFGGKTTITAQAWDRGGERLSRRTFESTVTNLGQTLIAGANALPLSGLPEQAAVRGRAVPLALGGVAVLALAAGAAFGVSASETSRGLSQPQTGCGGVATAYVDCLNGRADAGRRQATAANILYGAAALLGTSAGVIWVMQWP